MKSFPIFLLPNSVLDDSLSYSFTVLVHTRWFSIMILYSKVIEPKADTFRSAPTSPRILNMQLVWDDKHIQIESLAIYSKRNYVDYWTLNSLPFCAFSPISSKHVSFWCPIKISNQIRPTVLLDKYKLWFFLYLKYVIIHCEMYKLLYWWFLWARENTIESLSLKWGKRYNRVKRRIIELHETLLCMPWGYNKYVSKIISFLIVCSG